MLLYSAVIDALSAMIEVAGSAVPEGHPRKFFRFLRGQKHLIRHVRDTYRKDPNKPTVWVHASSLGEFSVARPLIIELKRRGMQIVLTFFSPSGYEALKDNHPNVDYLYYLPFDTNRNAKAFLDIVKPDKAVFIVSEYWFNYLQILKDRGIETYLVSAKISKKSIFYKWYGWLYRRCLPAYKHFFVIDKDSETNLKELGYNNVSVCGNPLFDNAKEKSLEDWSDPVIERFANGRDVFIAGSIHDDIDLKLVTDLANSNRDTRFIFVPHEINKDNIQIIVDSLKGKTQILSQCDDNTDMSDAQVLIVDFVGSLAYIYRYARWAYVGGGFTRYLHSLIEATVYGLPVAFGPVTHRKVTPLQIVEKGIGNIVTNSDELNRWFCALKSSPKSLNEISRKAKEYVETNLGSTKEIVDKISE